MHEGIPQVRCPKCGRGMKIPERFLSAEARERRQAREQFRKEVERAKRMRKASAPWLMASAPLRIVLALVLLGLAGGLLLVRGGSGRDAVKRTTQEQRAAEELVTLRVALELFRRDCGRYPELSEGLLALHRETPVAGWKGPYLTLLKPDPWRMPYGYGMVSNVVRVYSAGPDQQPGTGDDIAPTGWENHPRLKTPPHGPSHTSLR